MPVRAKAMHGLSLVELLIATVLGLIVAGAAVTLFATNRVTYAVSENMGRIQESTRIAFELMSRDLRDGGGNPCDNGSSLSYPMTNGLSASSTWWANWSNWMVGYTGATAFPDAAFGTGAGQRVAGTDAIEIKAGDIVTYTTAESVTASAAVAVASVAGLVANDILIICDYRSAAVFKATSFVGNTILHATGGTAPTNLSADIATAPPADASYPITGVPPEWSVNAAIARGRASRWFVGCNGRVACDQPGGRSLFMTTLRNNAGTLAGSTDEIAGGVSGMTLQYLQNGGNAYTDAAGVTDWTTVVALKITLTITGTERIAGNNLPISKTVQHVVSLRNHLQ